MTRKIIPILFLAASLTLSACAAPSIQQKPSAETTKTTKLKADKETETKTQSKEGTSSGKTVTLAEFESLKDDKEAEISTLKDEVELLTDQIDLLKKDKLTPDNSAIAFSQRPAGMLYFPVFTVPQVNEPKAAGYVAIKPQAEVSDKLRTLTQGISQILFAGRSMEVAEIRMENEKKIVFIDLKNLDQWRQVFQGSTGGGTNSQALVYSYLQNDYRNGWIDGVHFTIDGEPITFDHAPLLEETQYRD